jgi:hypothetical protein
VTDIEQKALELVNAELSKAGFIPLDAFPRGTAFYDAFYKVVEAHELDKARHAAEMREQAERFSEAVTGFWNYCKTTDTLFPAALSPFILAPVDPLVEAVQEVAAAEAKKFGLELKDYAVEQEWADSLRAALDARGLAIVKKEAVNG